MPRLDLFLVSGLILFLELACIRWVPAHVLYLSFFTNTVLLACFVGMSVGCLTARSPRNEILATPLRLAVLVALGLLVSSLRGKMERHTDVGNQSRPEVVFFGAEANAVRQVEFAVPVEVVAGLFFVLAAVVMVGPGQELGRAFLRVPNRTTAYALDLLGSLTGIALFSVCSTFQLPPVVWFAGAAVGLGYFVWTRREPGKSPAFGLGLLAVTVAATAVTSGLWPNGPERIETRWSPYYRVQFTPTNGYISTNLIGHQAIGGRESSPLSQYDLPYLLLKAADRPAPKRVLVIGAGNGNDLSRALWWCPPDAKIDAVEIDPVIRGIGAARHPDRPYADPRIVPHLNDGRNFLRRAPDGEYDLVVFALVDSLVLHSGYSNLRLESYLFTQESFRDVARVLKPDGTAVMYNFFRQGWVVARIRDQLRAAFDGTEPVTFVDPPPEGNRLDPDDAQIDWTGGALTALFAGRDAALAPLRAKLAASGGVFWMPRNPAPGPSDGTSGAFAAAAPGPGFLSMVPTAIGAAADLPPATDDWPFLYVRKPTLPDLTIRGTVLTAVLAVGVWWWFARRTGAADAAARAPASPDERALLLRSFFLGAGFMLIETRAVVQMALLFGSTWVVNTAVFASILVMALVGNLYAGWVKPRRLEPYYVGLFLALAANLAVPPDSFLGMDPVAQTVAACGLAFAPMLFAGVVFPVSFARSREPDRFFGANVAGALAGGLAENLSMVLGFRWLLVVAVGLYALSALPAGRGNGTPGADPGV